MEKMAKSVRESKHCHWYWIQKWTGTYVIVFFLFNLRTKTVKMKIFFYTCKQNNETLWGCSVLLTFILSTHRWILFIRMFSWNLALPLYCFHFLIYCVCVIPTFSIICVPLLFSHIRQLIPTKASPTHHLTNKVWEGSCLFALIVP